MSEANYRFLSIITTLLSTSFHWGCLPPTAFELKGSFCIAMFPNLMSIFVFKESAGRPGQIS